MVFFVLKTVKDRQEKKCREDYTTAIVQAYLSKTSPTEATLS